MFFSDWNCAQPEMLLIRKLTHPISQTTQKSTRTFVGDEVDGAIIEIVLQVFKRRPKTEQVTVPKRMTIKHESTAKPE